MSKYTLKTLCNGKILEIYEHRAKSKLSEILKHDKFYHAGETGPFDEVSPHPDFFVITDMQRYKLFEGNIKETILFLRKLK